MRSSSSSPVPNIFEVYSRYCEIESRHEHGSSKEELAELSRSLGASHGLFNDLYKLVASLDFSKYQRHNISEDTWRQVLAFSRCVYEDLEGYDPKGAWPVLIDDFVDHMYRTGDYTCTTSDFRCDCEDGYQSIISNTLRGLKLLPGSKRKSVQNIERKEEKARSSCDDYENDNAISRCKRSHQMMDLDMDLQTNYSGGHASDTRNGRYNAISGSCIHTSACAVENSLSEACNGHLGTSGCFNYGEKSKV